MDIWYLLWLQSLREAAGPLIESFFAAVSAIAVNPFTMFLPGIIYWCFDKFSGFFVLTSFTLGNFVCMFLKNTFCVYRPWIKDDRIHAAEGAIEEATGYSFPSGHTQMAASVYGETGFIYRRKYKVLKWFCYIFTILVAFSRNFLGVHTPQDVIVAFAVVIAVYYIVKNLIRRVQAKPELDLKILMIGLLIDAAFIAYVALKSYPMDYLNGELLVDPVEMQVDCFKSAGMLAGFLVGWYAERRTLKFTTDSLSRKDKIIRILCGIVVCLTALAVPRLLLSSLETRVSAVIRYFILMLSMVYLTPLVFTIIERKTRREQLEVPLSLKEKTEA